VFHLPAAGMLLVLGVDHLLDMGRTATNVVGNSVASVVVSRWEGLLIDGAPAAAPVEAPALGEGPAVASARSALDLERVSPHPRLNAR
jgi:hypothetical protein